MRIFTIIVALFAVALGACAHYADVVPGSNGIHEVTASPEEDDDDPDDDELSRDAIDQATDYCREVLKQTPQIISAHKNRAPDAESHVHQVVVKFKCR